MVTAPEKALGTAYHLALIAAKMNVDSEALAKEESKAVKNSVAALTERSTDFSNSSESLKTTLQPSLFSALRAGPPPAKRSQ